jgi:iduronate 2-sulfatase
MQRTTLIVLALIACFIPADRLVAAEKPNVLFILVDDLKASFGAYGDDWVQSPNLDSLAARGMLFNAAYCNQALCAPSRNSLLTGSLPTSLGIYNLATNFREAVPKAVTMPQFFMQHGYFVEGVGKVYHIGHGNHDDPASWSVPFYPESVVDYVLPESTGGRLTREAAYFSNQQLDRIMQLPRGAAWERANVPDDAYADGRIANEGIRRLQEAKDLKQPFFLAIGFTKPHLPFCAPEKYWGLYDNVDVPLAKFKDYPQGAPSYAVKPKLGELDEYEPIPESPPLSEDLERHLVKGYYASVSYMDAQVGRVLQELDRLGLAQNTIIVLWGDHGYHLGDHGMWTKHTNYEQANRIPLIFAGPGVVKSGSKSNALVETVDIFPTLAELAGLPSPDGPQPIDGKSLAPILTGDAESIRDHAFHAFPRPGNRLGRAIRTARYRLVEWKVIGQPAESAEFELYDYQDDPLETRNLAADHPEVVDSLRKILATYPEAKPPVVEDPSKTKQRKPGSALNMPGHADAPD